MVRPDFLVARAGKDVRDICFKHPVSISFAWPNTVERFVNYGIIDRLRQRYDDFAAKQANCLEIFFGGCDLKLRIPMSWVSG